MRIARFSVCICASSGTRLGGALGKMNYRIAAPDPSSLIESFRALGYTLPAAIADLLDNSITAGTANIQLNFHWSGSSSHICILDDGCGMSESELFQAMRPGSRSPLETRNPIDLGRFGLGLKTASFSQCRQLCVVSKNADNSIHAYTWDLDYVCKHKDWRLLTGPTSAAEKWKSVLSTMASGTAVVWSRLDRLAGSGSVQDRVAQSQFLNAMDHVRQHLALTFHRYLEDKDLRIIINGTEVSPWNPFMERHPSTWQTPEERIRIGRSVALFKGFVLPHKDNMTKKEWEENAGSRGWTGQQGFYVYRNRRLLLQGDWLRLGRPNPWTREEQYKLARIRLDINNDTDGEWQLDVKKSTARPPMLIREKLTDLAGDVRKKSREIFANRGQYGPRSRPVVNLERPWISRLRSGHRTYLINREHPLVSEVIKRSEPLQVEIESLLRFLEETVPVQQIWLDTAEQIQAIPYDGVDFADLRSDMRLVYEILLKSGIGRDAARERIRSMDPFCRYPVLIAEL